MAALFLGVLFVWVALMIVRLTLPRVRVSDGVLWLSYGVLVPGIVSTLVFVSSTSTRYAPCYLLVESAPATSALALGITGISTGDGVLTSSMSLGLG